MNRISRFVIITAGILLLAIPSWANYTPFPDLGHGLPIAPMIVFLDFAFDLFCIVLALAVLRKAGRHGLGEILGVGALATVAGFVADHLASVTSFKLTHGTGIPYHWLLKWYGGHGTGIETAVTALLAVPMILVAHWCFGRVLLRLSRREAVLLGIVIGVLTAPVGEQVNRWLSMSLMADHMRNSDIAQATIYCYMAVALGIADVMLLYLLRPISSLRRWQISCIGLALVAGGTATTLLPVRAASDTKAKILTCSVNLRRAYYAIHAYQRAHGSYPTTQVDLIRACAPNVGILHCPLDPDGHARISYTYQKPAGEPRMSGRWVLRCDHHPGPPLFLWDGGFSTAGKQM